MRATAVQLLAASVAAAMLAACGGGDDTPDAADNVVVLIEDAGIDVDASCVDEAVGELSDDERAALRSAEKFEDLGVNDRFVILFTPCMERTDADFQNDAQDYILTEVADALSVELVEATCEQPPSTVPGTRFACTATDGDGGEWEFSNLISADNEFTVDLASSPDD